MLGFLTALALAQADGPVDFRRDIRPILSDHCFACHGPDEARRQGGLRLDVPQAGSEKAAFVPGHPERSAAYLRTVTSDRT